MYFILNMWMFWIFGFVVEDWFGLGRFILFYLFCGVVVGLVYVLVNFYLVVFVFGVLGVIVGVIGCYLFVLW